MKKVLGLTLGGLQKKAITLALVMLLIAVLTFTAVFFYQNNMLADVVGETRTEQQNAISQVSRETMHQMLEGSLESSTALRAALADNDFSEIIHDVYMLRNMAEQLLLNRATITPRMPSLPDVSLDGTPSFMLLYEEGVDYTQSEYLGILTHMGSSMLAMVSNSDKVAACFIGLTDGTHLDAEEGTADKYDENGHLIPFPVRERPWFRGAVETGELYFTGIVPDAYDHTLTITCSAPIRLDGEIVAVLGLDIVLDNMKDFIGGSGVRGSHSYVVNDRGEIILWSEQDDLFDGMSPDVTVDLHSLGEEIGDFVDKALREDTDLTVLSVDGKEYYSVGVPMPSMGWAVITAVDKEITEQPEQIMLAEYDRINVEASGRFNDGMGKVRGTSLALLGLLIAVGVASAILMSRRMVKPIENMTRSIVRSSQTGEPFRMDDSYRTNDEMELLAEAFDDLSRKTKNYITQITAITAEKERIGAELSLATQIQASMLPHIFPAFPDRKEFDIFATMDPAKEVGGDFYDYFLIDDDHLCMVIADVSGKGVPAALFMMASKIILANNAKLGKSPAEILENANTSICSNNRLEMFVTVWLGILEISTGKLTAANAGHEYPVLKRPEGDFELLKDRHGFVIGGMDGMKYREYELMLEPGAKLFLYTDGVPEATDSEGAMFGTERMLAALNEVPDAEPEQILKHVRSAVVSFVKDAEQFDDLTMLCVEISKGAKEDRP